MKKFILAICIILIFCSAFDITANAFSLLGNRKRIFKVSIKGIDENNKTLYIENKVFSGTEGEYSFSCKEIEGYKVIGEKTKTVEFDSKNKRQTIVFNYQKENVIEPVEPEEKCVTLDFTKEKIGIALPSGGFLGSYTIGQLLYLRDIGINIEDFDSIIGTSVGAINLVSLLSNGLDNTLELWSNIKAEDIYDGDLSNTRCEELNKILDNMFVSGNSIGNLALIIRGFAGGSVSNEPLKRLLIEKVNFEKVLNSNIEVGMVTLNLSKLKTVVATNKNGLLTKDTLVDYAMMSSSCYPVFPIYKYNGEKYIDGGYLDSNNGKYLFSEFNCDKAIILDLLDNSSKFEADNKVVYCCQSQDLGSFLDTNQETIQRNIKLGYEDMKNAMKNVKIIK